MILRAAGIVLGVLAAALAAYGIMQEPPLAGFYWCAPVLLALVSVTLILSAEEKRIRTAQAERARTSAEMLKDMNKQQVHGEKPDRKTI
jgi:hypothetical protein